MNHEDIVNRIDRLEDQMYAKLESIDTKLDSVVQSSVESKIRIDAQSGQIKMLWTIFLAVASSVSAWIFNRLN